MEQIQSAQRRGEYACSLYRLLVHEESLDSSLPVITESNALRLGVFHVGAESRGGGHSSSTASGPIGAVRRVA